MNESDCLGDDLVGRVARVDPVDGATEGAADEIGDKVRVRDAVVGGSITRPGSRQQSLVTRIADEFTPVPRSGRA
jgi:hypothetical protein